MKKRTIILLSILILVVLLVITAYFLLIKIQSEVPEKLEDRYDIKVEKYTGKNVVTISPKEDKTENYIIYFHGGSYMAEITDAHWNFLDKIIQETKASIIVPDYPLTPTNNYKDVFEMVIPLYKEIIKNISPENLIIMGDSAGGGLALALEEKLGEEEIQIPEKLILISPWIDVTMSNQKIDDVEKLDKNLNKDTLKMAGIAYAGLDGMDNYLVNPINGPLDKLKNVTIYTGTYDILNPDAHLLQEKAKAIGIDIELKEYEGKEHIWLIYEQNQDFQDLIDSIKK